MTSVVEEVGVDLEGDRDDRVVEDPADLRHIQFEVDDEVARKGMPQVVEAQGRLFAVIRARAIRDSPEAATSSVAMVVRRAVGALAKTQSRGWL